MSGERTHPSGSNEPFAQRYYRDYVLKQTSTKTARSLLRVRAVLEMCDRDGGRLLSVGSQMERNRSLGDRE